MFYRGIDEFVDGLAPFIADGVDANEPNFVVVSADKIRRLTKALGRRTDHVQFGDVTASRLVDSRRPRACGE